MDVGWLNRNLVKRTDEIDLGENAGAMQGRREVLYVRNWVTVRNGDMVEGAIIPARPPISRCLLRDHVKWGSPVAGRRSDDAELEHVVKFVTSDLNAFWGQPSRPARDWRACCSDVVGDRVLHRCSSSARMSDARELGQYDIEWGSRCSGQKGGAWRQNL